MKCLRCKTEMIRSHHQEVEDISGYELVTLVTLDECPHCSVKLKLIQPVLPGELETDYVIG